MQESVPRWRGPRSVEPPTRTTGGSLLSASEVLKKAFPEKEVDMENRIKETSIRICNALEGHVKGPLGELGLDIGVDYHRESVVV